jgi:hypothetical protein
MIDSTGTAKKTKKTATALRLVVAEPKDTLWGEANDFRGWFDQIEKRLWREAIRVQLELAYLDDTHGDRRAFRRVAKTLRAALFELDALKCETVKALKAGGAS